MVPTVWNARWLVTVVLSMACLIVPRVGSADSSITPTSLLGVMNDARAEQGIPALRAQEALSEAAQVRVEEMASTGYFAHETASGQSPWSVVREHGYLFSRAAENLAVRYSTSQGVIDGWLASPGHRANLLDARLNEVGVGVAEGMYKGSSAIYVVALFAAPQSTSGSQAAAAVSTGVTVLAAREPVEPSIAAVPNPRDLEAERINALLTELRMLLIAFMRVLYANPD